MNGVWLLSWRHVRHHRVQTIILTLCIALSVFLPVETRRLADRYRADLVARADQTPLIAGAVGNRFDLTLALLYFRRSQLDPLPMAVFEDLVAADLGVVIPLNVDHTVRGFPLVATTPEYAEWRRLRMASGTMPLRIGDVVLGAEVAAALGVGVGDTVFTDQEELYDIARPPSLKMQVTGVLTPTGTADDRAAFTDLRTAWIVAGLLHGHEDAATEIDESLLLARTEDAVVVSGAMLEHNEVTSDTIRTYHLHGDASAMPLTGALVLPRDEKSGTILKARVNRDPLYRMLVPREVIDDLVAYVFRIKSVFDLLSALLAGTTALLTVLVMLLSMRLRASEMETLHRIGCSRFTVAKLYAAELGIILLLSVALAAAGVIVAERLLPNLVFLL